MTERLQKKIRLPKKTLTELLNDKSIVTGREVVQRINDKEKLRKQFDEAVEFEVRNGRGRKQLNNSHQGQSYIVFISYLLNQHHLDVNVTEVVFSQIKQVDELKTIH